MLCHQQIMKSQGYLYGAQCRNHKDFTICKGFLNKWISDHQLSLNDTCYYLNNYNHLQVRGEHRYARPSFAFKFLIKKNMKYLHKNEMEYCYHGTKVEFIKKIIDEGFLMENKFLLEMEMHTAKAFIQPKFPNTLSCMRIPTNSTECIFNLSKLKCTGEQDIYGKFSKSVLDQYSNIKYIHLLHKNLIKQTDIQWMTDDDKSIVIEAVIVKVHRINPIQGQYLEISKLIMEKMKV